MASRGCVTCGQLTPPERVMASIRKLKRRLRRWSRYQRRGDLWTQIPPGYGKAVAALAMERWRRKRLARLQKPALGAAVTGGRVNCEPADGAS